MAKSYAGIHHLGAQIQAFLFYESLDTNASEQLHCGKETQGTI